MFRRWAALHFWRAGEMFSGWLDAGVLRQPFCDEPRPPSFLNLGPEYLQYPCAALVLFIDFSQGTAMSEVAIGESLRGQIGPLRPGYSLGNSVYSRPEISQAERGKLIANHLRFVARFSAKLATAPSESIGCNAEKGVAA
jgi:hypothetical protein